MMSSYLAMDVGGTNITAALINDRGDILEKKSFPTKAERGPDAIIKEMLSTLKNLTAPLKLHKIKGLCIGVPGWINQSDGLIVKAPNLPGWKSIPLASIMSKALQLPVRLENDANLYAFGEWKYGVGRGLSNILLITLGTGVGGGLILERRLWTGSFSSSVEIGHALVDEKGALCGCGRNGCLETIASASGMLRLGRKWLKEGRPSLYQGRLEELSPKKMYDLACLGDKMSLHIFQQAGEALGRVTVFVCNLLGLEAVIVGGGAAGAFEFMRSAMWSAMAEGLIVTYPERIKLLKSTLGENAPLIGASALIKDFT